MFASWLAPLRKIKWVVYAKDPFAGPEAVLTYLSRYTHRVAISNRSLVRLDDNGVTFRYKDYRADWRERWKNMTLPAHEFIRRFLLHVLPKGFHRIRHYGLLANGNRVANIAKARELLEAPVPVEEPEADAPNVSEDRRILQYPCPCCGGHMIIIEAFAPGCELKCRPPPEGIDSS